MFLLCVTLCKYYYNNRMKNCLFTQLWTLSLVIENSLNKL